jgi:hypothetical protein
MRAASFFVFATFIAGCHAQPTPSPAKIVMPPTPPTLDRIERGEFNFRAQERYAPVFWRADGNDNKRLDPEELSVPWGPQEKERSAFVNAQGFTPAFYDVYRSLLAPIDDSARTPEESARRELERRELRYGKPTLIETDFSLGSDEDRAIEAHLFNVAALIEKIYMRQLGTLDLLRQVPHDDPASFAVFWRNHGPWCVTPQLENDPKCSALPVLPPHRSGLYPLDIQDDAKFCDKLAAQPNGKDLMGHFSTVVKDGAGFRAVLYSEAYREDSERIALELDALAGAISSDNEKPLKAYAIAAAKAFRTNDWEPANQAWLEMGGSSSHYYLRVAPDEVYYEPCGWKAGYALTYARMNADSKTWRDRLSPVKGQMEQALAKLAGAPYKARDVAFRLPDFIDIILNAGDQRAPHGATIGDSLPNWGPVAARGGRTVAMVNIGTDADSKDALAKQMASLYCSSTAGLATTDPRPAVMSTVLHEASHNLGPSHDYMVNGKKDSDVFGGPLASTMEELKAQTSALYFSRWLAEKHVITVDEATAANVRDVAWAFGHISQGMYEADGKPKNYSQLASIQMGTLWKGGVLLWHADRPSAGGDQGCFELDLSKWTKVVDALATRVLRAKGRGDRKDAERMKAEFVDDKGEWARLEGIITERWLRTPKATFLYGVR